MKLVSLDILPLTTTSHNNAGKKQTMVQKGEIPHLLQFSQVTFAPGEVVAAHTHADLYEVFFVEKGEGTYIVNGKSNVITKGTCITIEPGELHELVNTGTGELVLTYFNILDEK